MKTFHYFAPAPEEQRGFVMQFLGTVLGVVVAAFLFYRTADVSLRAVLIGAGLALFYRLGHAAWALELKARRSQNAEIGVDAEGLHLTGSNGAQQSVPWSEVQDIGLKGGRLSVTWPGGNLIIGSREVEDGMTLVRLVMNKGQDDTPRARSNFIPLDPR